jgi:hypothetical protein
VDWYQEHYLGRKLPSVAGMPPAAYQSIEQHSAQFGLRTMQLGGATLEAEILRLQVEHLDEAVRILNRIDTNTTPPMPAFED